VRPGALVDALVQAQIEFVRDPADADLIRGPQQRETRHCDHGLEPRRLVVRRRNAEIQDGAFLVPHAAVVGGRDAEVVVARNEIRILYLSDVDHFPPVLVLPIELESETHLLGRDQAQRCELNTEIANERRQSRV
jgi:hypothetical protein